MLRHPPRSTRTAALFPSPTLCRSTRGRRCRRRAAALVRRLSLCLAPIGPGDDFEQVPAGVVPVDPATPVIAVDLAFTGAAGIGPVVEASFTNPAEDGVALRLADFEGIVLHGRIPALLRHEIQRDAIVDRNHVERSQARRWR